MNFLSGAFVITIICSSCWVLLTVAAESHYMHHDHHPKPSSSQSSINERITTTEVDNSTDPDDSSSLPPAMSVENSDKDHSESLNVEHSASGHHGHDHGHMNHESPMMHDDPRDPKADNSQHAHANHHQAEHMMEHDGNDMDMHMHMDMNDTGMPHMHMWFYVGVEAVVLFKEWNITTVGGMVCSVIGVILLGMCYEGLKYFREFLFKKYISSMQFSTVAVTGESGRVTQVHKVEKHRMMSAAHGIQTCLHVVQIIFSYFLMLIFMTYNFWLCLAVVVGAGLGYFIFGWKKATVVDITEHCH